jgi:hypothetical protein
MRWRVKESPVVAIDDEIQIVDVKRELAIWLGEIHPHALQEVT